MATNRLPPEDRAEKDEREGRREDRGPFHRCRVAAAIVGQFHRDAVRNLAAWTGMDRSLPCFCARGHFAWSHAERAAANQRTRVALDQTLTRLVRAAKDTGRFDS